MNNHSKNRNCSFFFLLFIVLFCSYSNTFQASWHLDDEPNILTNSKIQLNEFSAQSILDSITAHPNHPESTKLYRPLPCFTLALNWYMGQNDVTGYHIVNFVIHFLTGWFLFLTIRIVLKLYCKTNENSDFINSAAIIAALLWALAPIQTQAVTYIIQRMASMAAMFTVIAFYTYLRGRQTQRKKKYIWYSLCLFSFLAALGSKENAILIPVSLVLIDVTFYQRNISRSKIIQFSCIACLALTFGLFFTHYILGVNPFSFINGYESRSFTLFERVATEPRIVLVYLSKTLIPLSERLSLDYDVLLSTSLFQPWTTLPAILAILFLVSISIKYLKKYPIIAFPVLFFFLNHVVESTIFPLELVFEHRNYLPSLFLFLPIAFAFSYVLYGPAQFSRSGRLAIAACISVLLAISGYATYERNAVWKNERTLWQDTLKKAPGSPRAAHNLGRWYRQFGQYEQAYYFFQRAFNNADNAANPQKTRIAALNGLASVAYMLGKYDRALGYFDQCLEADSSAEACLKNRTLAYLQLGAYEQAQNDAVKLVGLRPEIPEYHYLAALSFYKENRLDGALIHINKIASRAFDNHKVMGLTGAILIDKMAYNNSLFFLKRARKLAPGNIIYQLLIAMVYMLDTNEESLFTVVDNIFLKFSVPEIRNGLTSLKNYQIDDNNITILKRRVLAPLRTDSTLPNG